MSDPRRSTHLDEIMEGGGIRSYLLRKVDGESDRLVIELASRHVIVIDSQGGDLNIRSVEDVLVEIFGEPEDVLMPPNHPSPAWLAKALRGTQAAFKFAEDSRRDKDKQ